MVSSQAEDDFPSRSASFVDWLKQRNITISPKIELADLRTKDAGRGVLAKEDIEEDEELFIIPRTSILTVETSSLPAELKGTEDPWLSLIIAMIYEYQLANDSTWKPYFDVLPAHFDTLMFWSESDLDHLQGSAVVQKIGKDSADEAFKIKVIPQLKQHSTLFRLDGVADQDLLFLCHRMGSTIMAYAFDLEKPGEAPIKNEEDGWEEDEEEGGILPKGMVPFADMLNADADRNNAKLFYQEDKVVMKSIRPVGRGEELFNDYGPLPNADVLRRYGYVTSNYAQYDVVEVTLDLIKDAAKELHKLQDDDVATRLAYLDEQGVLEDGYDVARASSEDGQFPDDCGILMNTLVMPRADLDKAIKKNKLPKPELSREGLTLLANVLRRRKAFYESVGPDDKSDDVEMRDASVADYSRSRRQDMARQVIHGEKQVLQEASDTIQGLLQVNNSRKRKAEPEPEPQTKHDAGGRKRRN